MSAVDITNRLNEINFNSSLIRELRAVAFITKLLDAGYIKNKYKQEIRKFLFMEIFVSKKI